MCGPPTGHSARLSMRWRSTPRTPPPSTRLALASASSRVSTAAATGALSTPGWTPHAVVSPWGSTPRPRPSSTRAPPTPSSRALTAVAVGTPRGSPNLGLSLSPPWRSTPRPPPPCTQERTAVAPSRAPTPGPLGAPSTRGQAISPSASATSPSTLRPPTPSMQATAAMSSRAPTAPAVGAGERRRDGSFGALAVDPHTPANVYAGTGDDFSAAAGGIFKSTDYLDRSEEHTSELQSRLHLVCRLL